MVIHCQALVIVEIARTRIKRIVIGVIGVIEGIRTDGAIAENPGRLERRGHELNLDKGLHIVGAIRAAEVPLGQPIAADFDIAEI